jgi:hypothetical protein
MCVSSSQLCLGALSSLFDWDFHTKILCRFLTSAICATFSTHFELFDLMTLTIFGIKNSSLCTFFFLVQSDCSSYKTKLRIGPFIFYMLYLFLYFCCTHSALTFQQSAFTQSFRMAKPNPYKIINKITTLGVLIFIFWQQTERQTILNWAVTSISVSISPLTF